MLESTVAIILNKVGVGVGVKVLSGILAKQLEKATKGLTDSSLATALESCDSPWELILILQALEYVPFELQTLGQPTLAENLTTSLRSLLEHPSGEVLRLLPSSDEVLLDPAPASLKVQCFLRRILVQDALDEEGAAGALASAAARLVSRISSQLSIQERAILARLDQLHRAIETQMKCWSENNTRGLSELLAQIDGQLETLLDRRLTSHEDQVLQLHIDGTLVRLHATRAIPSKIPAEWRDAAEACIRALVTPGRVGVPPLRSVLVEPRAVRFASGTQRIDSNGAQATPLASQIGAWLNYGPDVPLVLVGDPGLGKSTACMSIVADLYQRWKSGGESPEDYFPILIHLRDIRSDVAFLGPTSFRGKALFRACVARLQRRPELEIDGPPEGQKTLLILDGFDELAFATLAPVEAFFDGVSILSRHKNVAVMLTGRPVALQPFWFDIDTKSIRGSEWRRLKLEPFRRGPGNSCEQFVRFWLLACETAGLPTAEAEMLYAIAEDGGAFGDVVETPVLLASICEVLGVQKYGIGAIATIGATGALEWLVERSIELRANPIANAGQNLAGHEVSRRRKLYGEWAWQAVLSGGTEFETRSFAERDRSPADSLVVEFFFLNSETHVGRAVFMHRTICEYLAACYVLDRIGRCTSDSEATNVMLDCGSALAREEIALDGNFKAMVAKRVLACSKDQQLRIERASASLIDCLYCNLGELDWSSTTTSTPSVLGAAADLGLLLNLAANRGNVDWSHLSRAAELRSFSPRCGSPWFMQLSSLRDARMEGTDFVGMRFSRSEVYNVSFEGSNFAGCLMDEGRFSRCSFRGANLSGTTLQASCLVDCDLTDATLDHAVLDNCRFRGCRPHRGALESARSVLDCIMEGDVAFAHTLSPAIATAIRWEVGGVLHRYNPKKSGGIFEPIGTGHLSNTAG